MLTFNELGALVIAAIGLILTLLNIFDKIATIKQRVREPQEDLNARLEVIEQWQRTVEGRLTLGNDHFAYIDEGNYATNKALLALMDHALNGNNLTELTAARNALDDYLARGKGRYKHDAG